MFLQQIVKSTEDVDPGFCTVCKFFFSKTCFLILMIQYVQLKILIFNSTYIPVVSNTTPAILHFKVFTIFSPTVGQKAWLWLHNNYYEKKSLLPSQQRGSSSSLLSLPSPHSCPGILPDKT